MNMGESRVAGAAGIATVQVLYFARLREAFGCDRESVELPGSVGTVAELTAWLRNRGEVWAHELAAGKPVRVAVNQDIADASTPVRGGDEIAFFPPVTGG
jgi:molybdopterin synthase sulfur carrier subunit